MLLTEWNNEDWFEVVREEAQEFGRAEGRAEGLAEGAEERDALKTQLNDAARLMKTAGIDTVAICQSTGLTPDDVARL